MPLSWLSGTPATARAPHLEARTGFPLAQTSAARDFLHVIEAILNLIAT
jgi:hypothetical protein